MKFSEGSKSFEMCTNCSEPASPAHILECQGLTKQDLADYPLLVLDFLGVSMLSVLGVWQSVDAPSTTTLKGTDAIEMRYDAIEGRRRHGRDDGLRKTGSKDVICMD
ncbi:hypothetical protein TNCV_1273341 [Trichonephila clavipes]|nr:hypothetical protein TNCV_1273341 [Trichonephila clavipes]